MIKRSLSIAVALAGVVGAVACNMDVSNPSVIDAATFNPNADGTTLALSAQTNFFIAFQSVGVYGGLPKSSGAAPRDFNRIESRRAISSRRTTSIPTSSRR